MMFSLPLDDRSMIIESLQKLGYSVPDDADSDALGKIEEQIEQEEDRKKKEIYLPLLYHATNRPVEPSVLQRAIESYPLHNKTWLQSQSPETISRLKQKEEWKAERLYLALKDAHRQLENVRKNFNRTRWQELKEIQLSHLCEESLMPENLKREIYNLREPLVECHDWIQELNYDLLQMNKSMMVPKFSHNDCIVSVQMSAIGEDGKGKPGRAWTTFDGQMRTDESTHEVRAVAIVIDFEMWRQKSKPIDEDGVFPDVRPEYPKVRPTEKARWIQWLTNETRIPRPSDKIPYKAPSTYPIGIREAMVSLGRSFSFEDFFHTTETITNMTDQEFELKVLKTSSNTTYEQKVKAIFNRPQPDLGNLEAALKEAEKRVEMLDLVEAEEVNNL
eukprot:jgi/Bigna1/137897/aug1.41_g12605